MPFDVDESPTFQHRNTSGPETSICYSAYQRELSKLYVIVSPLIEMIFGDLTSERTSPEGRMKYLNLVSKIRHDLEEWRRHIPAHLSIELDHDVSPNTPKDVQVHRLQALALRLAFDNLTITLHRPFLAQQVESLSNSSPSSLNQHELSPSLESSAEQWWNAAVQTSRITELPQLAHLATDCHIVSFLAINLFKSAIVMVVCALSDPLSDRAQEAKRYITRIYRLEEILGKRSSLPKQSTSVLRDVIRLLLMKEEEAMLASVEVPDISNDRGEPTAIEGSLSHSISVEDTLRVPLNAFGDPKNQIHQNTASFVVDYGATSNARLNKTLASVQKCESSYSLCPIDITVDLLFWK
jgi:hypothetical protein